MVLGITFLVLIYLWSSFSRIKFIVPDITLGQSGNMKAFFQVTSGSNAIESQFLDKSTIFLDFRGNGHEHRLGIISIMFLKKKQTWVLNNLPGSLLVPCETLSLFRFAMLSGRFSNHQVIHFYLSLPWWYISPIIFHQGFWRERKSDFFWLPFCFVFKIN